MKEIILIALGVLVAIVLLVILASLIWYFVLPAFALFCKSIFKIADKLSDKLFRRKDK